MPEISDIIWNISEESIKRVKDGTAKIDSGGVRDFEGKLIELVKPIIKTIDDTYSAPPSVSAGNAVTSKQIEEMLNKGLSISNNKLESILNKTSLLAQNTVLSWVNTAINLANLGTSIVFYRKQNQLISDSFQQQEAKINRVQESLNELSLKADEILKKENEILDRIEHESTKKILNTSETYIKQAKSDIDELFYSRINIEVHGRNIALFLNGFSTFLSSLLSEFEQDYIEPEFAIETLYTLETLFSKEVELFSVKYYEHYKSVHPNLNDWIKTISSLGNNEKLKKETTLYMMTQLPTVFPLERKQYSEILNSTFLNNAYYIEVNNHEAKKLTEKYADKTFDEILTEKIKNDEPLIL